MKKIPRALLPRRDVVVTFSDPDRRKLVDLLGIKGRQERKTAVTGLAKMLSSCATTIANADRSMLFVSDSVAALRTVADVAQKLAAAVDKMDSEIKRNFEAGHPDDIFKPAIDFDTLTTILRDIGVQFAMKQATSKRRRGLEVGRFRDEQSREMRTSLEQFFDARVHGKPARGSRRKFVDKALDVVGVAISQTRAATS